MFPFIPFFGNIGYAAPIASQALAGFNSISLTATADLEGRMILVSMARQLAISSPSAASIIRKHVSGIVGEGITYQPPKNTELLTDYRYDDMVDYVKKRFALASHTKQLDAQKDMTFPMMQELACRNWLLSGDVFFIRKFRNGESSWRAVESDRVQTPYYCAVKDSFNNWTCTNPDNGHKIIDGVELDEDAIPCAYWVLKEYIVKPWLVQRDQIERIPAFDDDGKPLVLHLFNKLRPDQYRGVPLLAPLIETLHSRKNYSQAELQAAALQAAVFGFISSQNPAIDETEPLPSRELDRKIPLKPVDETTPEGTPTMTLDPRYAEEADSDIWWNQNFPKPKTVSAGQVVHLAEGEDVKFLQSTHPNQNYGAFVSATDRDIAAAMGLPTKVLTSEYDGSYSACKAAIQVAVELFDNYRAFFLDKFVKPIFEIYCSEILQGAVDDPDYVAKCLSIESGWKVPLPICLDQKVELESYKLALDMGLVTRDEVAFNVFGHSATGTPVDPTKTDIIEKV